MKKNSLVLLTCAFAFAVCVGITTANAAATAKGPVGHEVAVIENRSTPFAAIEIKIVAQPISEIAVVDFTATPWKNAFFWKPFYTASATCFNAPATNSEPPGYRRSCGDLSLISNYYHTFQETASRSAPAATTLSSGTTEKAKIKILNPAARTRRLC